MSSGAIMAQIQNCGAQLQNCETEIAKKNELLSRQKRIQTEFSQRLPEYEQQITARRSRASIIDGYSGQSTFAKGYAQNMQDTLWGAQYQNNKTNLNEAQAAIQKAVAKTEQELRELGQQRTRLNAELSNLNQQYADAQRREAEEAAAAAAAAQAAAGNARKR